MALDTLIKGALTGTGADVNALNELKVSQPSLISTLNASSTNLTSAQVFTGTGEDVSQYAEIRVYVYADQAGSISVQFSSNGTTWGVLDTYAVTAGVGKPITLGPAGQFFRIVYTNGGTGTTIFNLQTVYHKAQGRGSTQKPADARNLEIDCDEVIAYLAASDGTVANLLRNQLKGVQGAFGLATQDLKDSGRSQRVIFLDKFQIAAVAETLLTASYSTDNGTPTTGTSYTVTVSKRFRIQSVTAYLTSTTGNTTAVHAELRIRANNAGAAIVSSPVQMVAMLQGVAAANAASLPVNVDIPDGWEFVAGAGIGITVACPGYVVTTAAPLLSLVIRGYEY